GVLIVNNYKIYSARYFMKKYTLNVDSFEGPPIGSINGHHRIIYHMEITKKHTANSMFAKINITNLDTVEILYSYLGMGDIPNTWLDPHLTQGIVVAGMGGGSLPNNHLHELK